MSPTGWWVVCDDYACGPIRTRPQAESKLAEIERCGRCRHEHRVEER